MGRPHRCRKIRQTHFKKVLLEKSHYPLEREILGIEKTANINFFEDITAVTIIGMIKDEEPVIAFSGNLNKDHLLGLLKKEEPEDEGILGKITGFISGLLGESGEDIDEEDEEEIEEEESEETEEEEGEEETEDEEEKEIEDEEPEEEEESSGARKKLLSWIKDLLESDEE